MKSRVQNRIDVVNGDLSDPSIPIKNAKGETIE
jgi:hypothetical protein